MAHIPDSCSRQVTPEITRTVSNIAKLPELVPGVPIEGGGVVDDQVSAE
jgi:hypothetical protein